MSPNDKDMAIYKNRLKLAQKPHVIENIIRDIYDEGYMKGYENEDRYDKKEEEIK